MLSRTAGSQRLVPQTDVVQSDELPKFRLPLLLLPMPKIEIALLTDLL
jgi:hypothetical protein